jgi:dihydrodipicolinate synthase/N-acetylneuraminate lyase
MILPHERIRPRRHVQGISAILLPFDAHGHTDTDAFAAHVTRTATAGLIPAINMDTGYGNFLPDTQKQQLLELTRVTLGGGPFVAGVFVPDVPGANYNADVYLRGMDAVRACGGTPVVCQSFGLTALPDDALVRAYTDLGQRAGEFIAFELGQAFAPFGRIYAELVQIRECLGAKHSSLHRQPEWDRLSIRDRLRPGFRVYTGNDLAIDMVMYGSDYLLGLSTFAPAAFALRDSYWAAGDARFYELNDVLQYLGFFAFRAPVPAYKHSAAMFLHLQGAIATDATHPRSPTRPSTDRAILQELLAQLQACAGA